MTSKLVLFNESLAHLRERKISSLSEARESRRALDDVYDGVCAGCLEAGYWNWAMRAVVQTSSDSLTPEFGFLYAFEKPTDWLRTYVVSDMENLRPLLHYADENDVLWADCDPLYIKYVSDDSSYGMDLSLWPQSFTDFVALRLAVKAGPRISNNNELIAELAKQEVRAMRRAQGKDAMNEPPGFPPRGSWSSARAGGFRFPPGEQQPS